MLSDKLFARQGNWLFRFRGIIPVGVLGAALHEYYRTELEPGLFPLEGTRWEYPFEMGCLLISLIGFALRVYTVGHTPEGTSGRNTERQVADKLNTTGIYSVMRNPLYVGNFFMWLGIALLTANAWFVIAFILFYILYYERIIFAEEQYLQEKFGETYRLWADRTPSVLPRLRNFCPPSQPFSLRKVLFQEKNGLFALIAVFSLMDVSGEWLAGEAPKYGWLLVLAGLCAAGYTVLKYMKRRALRA